MVRFENGMIRRQSRNVENRKAGPGAPSLRVLCARVGFHGPVPLGILFLLATHLRQPLDHRDQTEQRGVSLVPSDF